MENSTSLVGAGTPITIRSIESLARAAASPSANLPYWLDWLMLGNCYQRMVLAIFVLARYFARSHLAQQG